MLTRQFYLAVSGTAIVYMVRQCNFLFSFTLFFILKYIDHTVMNKIRAPCFIFAMLYVFFKKLKVVILIVRLSLLTMTNLNRMREMYCLCVLRWLIRPSLALNCLLQMEHQRSEQDSSVGEAFALALRCARFCSASLILFASDSLAPLLMKPRDIARSCAICSHDSAGMLKSLREALRVSLYRFF